MFITSVCFTIMTGASPVSYSFWNYKKSNNPYSFKNYTISKRDMQLNSAIASIQEGASVCCAKFGIYKPSGKRDIFYVFPYEYERADYIILDEKRLKYVGDYIENEKYDILLKEISKHTPSFFKTMGYIFQKKVLFPLIPSLDDPGQERF